MQMMGNSISEGGFSNWERLGTRDGEKDVKASAVNAEKWRKIDIK